MRDNMVLQILYSLYSISTYGLYMFIKLIENLFLKRHGINYTFENFAPHRLT